MKLDLLSLFDKKAESSTTAEPEIKEEVVEETVSASEVKSEETKEETSSDETWSLESLKEELKKTREEAAKARIEKKKLEEELKSDFNQKLKSLEEKYSPLAKEAAEARKLREQEEDKKRSLEERLAHREQKLAELENKIPSIQKEYDDMIADLNGRMEKLMQENTRHMSFWEEQLNAELKKVPERYKTYAEVMMKGASDVKEKLDLLRKAADDGMFGTKKVSVNHATPGAKDGARLDADRTKTDPNNQSTKSKIREGLKEFFK